jgi:hypothetical protein
MKNFFNQITKKRLVSIALLLSFFLLMMCMTITGVTQPAIATIGEEINITVDAQVQPIDTDSYRLVFGFLAPVSWNAQENATAVYTSSVGNGTLVLATDTDIATNSTLTWSDEIESVIGIGENYGLVKWVVFLSESPIAFEDGVTINAQINLTLIVGQDNITTQMGYIIANSGYGIGLDFGNNPAYSENFTPCMEVTGGTNNPINICGPAPSPIVISPNTRTLNDIIKINFDAAKGDTSLFDASQVYFCGTALVDGVEVSNCGAESQNTMENVGNNLWEITLWPNSFFGATPNAEISDMSFTFRNADGAIIIQDPETFEDFRLIENCD